MSSLTLKYAKYTDAGRYLCTARSAIGEDEQSAYLEVRCEYRPLLPRLPPSHDSVVGRPKTLSFQKFRCSKNQRRRRGLHLGGKRREHQLRGPGSPQRRVDSVAERRAAAPQRQRHERQDLQKPVVQLPSGKRSRASHFQPQVTDQKINKPTPPPPPGIKISWGWT